jgi:hypothetical protein
MRQVLTRENLQRAWEQVRANHGAPGCDGMTVEAFPDFVRSSLRHAFIQSRTLFLRRGL